MVEKGHILIIDHREICDLVQEYLSVKGYRVSTAQNVAETRKVMAQIPVDLVILDLVLPSGEDGLTLARSLRQESPNVGIITLTGRVDHTSIGFEMGANWSLPKPFGLRELLAGVNRVLGRTSTQTHSRQF